VEFAGGGRLAIHITPADMGKRVSVRRVSEIIEGRPVFSDTVGVLTSWSEGVLIITRRDGVAVRILESALVAGKVVPDAPARRRALAAPTATTHDLQQLAARGWPALESERLGDWTLRAAVDTAAGSASRADGAAARSASVEGGGGRRADSAAARSASVEGGGGRRVGFTRRANSVLPVGDPGVPMDEALSRVTDWYRARGLVPYIQVTTGSPDADERLAQELAARGWVAEAHALLRTAPIAPIADGPGAEQVVLGREPDAGWLARYHRTGELAGAALKVLTGGASVWFAEVPAGPGEPPRAIGRCVVDGEWAGFAAVEVDPAYQRTGMATAVMAALARRAVDEGARGAYLQVEEENGGARALYDGMGFTTHHRYHYRRPGQFDTVG
jgi:N-acetylglutamate synthase